MKYTVSKSVVQVVGKIWMPMTTAATEYTLSAYEVANVKAAGDGTITREAVEHWVDTHAGDFSSVTDFYASLEDGNDTVEIPWASEESELTYWDCVSPAED